MRWLGGRESKNVEYGSGGRNMLVGGGLGTLIIGVIVYLLGGNPDQVLRQSNSPETSAYQKTETAKDATDHFIAVVLAETEDVWGAQFKEMGKVYEPPTLHVFDGTVGSACGQASSATGPFYCPADQKVYLDKSFFREMSDRFHAGGDFANAYVIAHEVGHHVQQLLGTSAKYEAARRGLSEKQANKLSVMLELQADFYAGVWAHYVDKSDSVVQPGDIEAALNAANAIGDDRLQRQSRGTVVPDGFTHGTSAQRMYWFRKGYVTGDIGKGNTFKGLDEVQ